VEAGWEVETGVSQELEAAEVRQGEYPLLRAEQAQALRLGSARQPTITSELGGPGMTQPMFFS
jgi:hypothetical protein